MPPSKGVLYLLPNLLHYPEPQASPPSLPQTSPPATPGVAPADEGVAAARDAARDAALPAAALSRLRLLRRFVVEGEKAAWRLLSLAKGPRELGEVSMERLDEHSPPGSLPGLLDPLEKGEDIGLLSEAGLPCVADPGGALVALAHDRGIRVVPLSGPSSIVLALAASGLDGQRFSFLGYLPREAALRKASLAEIERLLRADGATRIFIETPYRNARLLLDCLEALDPSTRLCVAVALTAPGERIRSASVARWRSEPWPVGKEPAVFLVGRVPGTASARAPAPARTLGPGSSLDRRGPIGHSESRCRKNKKR